MLTEHYRDFVVQQNNKGIVRITAWTPAARTALVNGYGLNVRYHVTFKDSQVADLKAAKDVVDTLYTNQDNFMKRQELVTRNAIRGSNFGG